MLQPPPRRCPLTGRMAKKGVGNLVVHLVELELKAVQKLVQSDADDLLNGGVIQFRAQAAQALLGLVSKTAHGGAGNEVQRGFRFHQTVVHGARKLAVQQQEVRHAERHDAPEPLAIHLQGAGRLEHRRPLDVVRRRAHVAHPRQQHEVFHVEDARGFVGALEQPPEAPEVPALAVRHGGVRNADEQIAGVLHVGEEIVRCVLRLPGRSAHHEVRTC